MLLVLTLWPGVAFGQAEALLPVDDARTMLIGRLQRRGLLDALDPTSLPHRQGDVRAAIARVDTARLDATARGWLRRLARTTASDRDYGPREVRAEAELSFGLTASDTRRLDGLRPLALDRTGDPDANTEVLNAGRFTFFPNAMPRLVAERPGAVVHFAPRHDLYLNSDPDGLDLVRRAMLRSDESYVRLRRGLGAAAFGRYRQHWGRPGEDAVLLSDWARSFDRLTVQLGGSRYSLETVFGEAAYALNISSTKSMTGHLLGGAGGIEALACVLALQHQCIPPTINHFTDDPELNPRLNFTFNQAQERPVRVALSNTFGFGGHNTSVIFRAFSE